MKTRSYPSLDSLASIVSPRLSALSLSALIEVLEARIAPAFTSAVAGAAASFQGDAASDSLVITESGGFLVHNRFAAGDAGFESALDFDSALAGVQTLAVGVESIVNADGGSGADTFSEVRSTDFTVGALTMGGSITLAHSSGAHQINLTSAISAPQISITADAVNITAAVNAGTGLVTLKPFTAGTAIDLGGADGALTLGLTSAELNFITAGITRIGHSASGDVLVTAGINPTGTAQLELISGGQITSAEGVSLTGGRLALTAASGINLTTRIGSLEAITVAGGIVVREYDDLTIGGVNDTLTGISAGGGEISIIGNRGDYSGTMGSLTVNEAVVNSGGGDISLIFGILTQEQSNVGIHAPVTASGGNGKITISAEDNLTITAAVSTVGTGGISLIADETIGLSANAGNLNISGGGTITTVDGAILLQAADSAIIGAAISATGTGSITLNINSAIDGVGDFTNDAAGTLTTQGGSIIFLDSVNRITVGGAVTVTGGTGNIVIGARTSLTVNAAVSIIGAESTGYVGATMPTTTIGTTGTVEVFGTGNITFSSGLSSNTPFTNQGKISSHGGNVTVRFDDQRLELGSTITVAANREVNLRANTGGVGIDLGSSAGGLNFTTAELATITGGQLRLTSAANITLTDSFAFANVQTLVLEAVGGVIDGTAGEQTDLTVSNLAIKTSTGIGSANDLDVSVSRLAFRNVTSGAVNLSNAGDLTIGSIFDVTTSQNSALGAGNTTTLFTPGSLTVEVDTASVGDLTLTVGDTRDTLAVDQSLTVKTGTTLQSTEGNIVLRVEDDIALESGSTIQLSLGSVTIAAGYDDLDGRGAITGAGNFSAATTLDLSAIQDLSIGSLSATNITLTTTGGAILDGNGSTVNITATTLILQAKTGIGTGTGGALETQLETIEAATSTGGIFITNGVTAPVTLTIGGLTSSIGGVRVGTSGGIEVTNTGDIQLSNVSETVQTPVGDVLLRAAGTLLINTGGVPAVSSDSGNVVLQADRFVLTAGDTITASGSVTIAPVTAGQLVNIGSATDLAANTLEISAAELDGIAAGSIRIGSATAGNLHLSENLAPAHTDVLHLSSGGTITQAAGTSIDVASLVLAGGSVSLTPGLNVSGNVSFAPGTALTLNLNGTTAGTGYGQLEVDGTVDLRGSTLSFTVGYTTAGGDSYKIVDNDGADAVIGTFAGLPAGSAIRVGADYFRIAYNGGDGNDVVLTRLEILPVTLAKNQKSATFIDADGDIVTITTSKGKFDQADFVVIASGQGGELALLNLSDDAGEFAGANISITAKKVKGGTGNGFTDVGYINSTGFALGALTVKGDLGQVDAGSGDPLKSALTSLTVQSLGLRGASTQPDQDGSSDLAGKLGSVVINGHLSEASIVSSASIGNVTIKGSFLGGSIRAGTTLGAVKVFGDIAGTDGGNVTISALGKAIAPKTGVDLAIASITVNGSVSGLRLLAGYDTAGQGLNADASIGAIVVNKNWSASSVLAGVGAGTDTLEGTTDDDKLSGIGVRDNARIYSSIASVLIKGTATGSATLGESFGIVAEQIGKAQIGTTKLAFTKGARGANDFFPIAGTTNFTIGEVS